MTKESNEPGRGAGRALSDRVRSLRLGSEADAPRTRSRLLPWIVTFVLLLTTVAFAYRAYSVGNLPGQGASAKDGASGDRKGDRPGAGSGSTSISSDSEVVLESQGFVIPLSLVQVSPKVGGQIAWLNPAFEEGKQFKIGDVLACIENLDYQADFDQARAAWRATRQRRIEVERTMPEEIKQAQADLEESRQTATQLKLDYDRNKRLAVGNAVAMRDLEQTQYAYDATTARVRKLEASLRLIKIGRLETRVQAAFFDEKQALGICDKARIRLEWTEVMAPVNGTILTKKAELGNIVNPAAFSSGISASLCDMADLSQLEIDMSIQERDIARVVEGQRCRIMPEAYQKDKKFLERHPQGYEGYVSRLMPTADRSKGAIPVRVRVLKIPEDEVGKYLRPDMRALVTFMHGLMPPEAKNTMAHAK